MTLEEWEDLNTGDIIAVIPSYQLDDDKGWYKLGDRFLVVKRKDEDRHIITVRVIAAKKGSAAYRLDYIDFMKFGDYRKVC